MPEDMRVNREVIEKGTFEILSATADTEAIRREDFEGEEHLVVPIIAIVEGVLQGCNAPTPELALAEVFGLFPTSWNGRPVTLNHPELRGMKISASLTPDVFAQETLGFLFNTNLDEKKLKTEAWINLSKVEEAGEGAQKEIARFESGELVEVSTGLFALTERADGTYEGDNYNNIWTHVVPDHLAILPEGTVGACSVEDGAGGPRLNKENDMPDEIDENDEENKNSMVQFLTGLRDKFSGVFKLRSNKAISDIDTRRALTSALVEEEPNGWFEIVAVFESTFVYAEGFDGTLLSRGFSVADEGPVTLSEDVTKVRPVTEFVSVNLTEEKDMTTNTKVEELIANEATQFTEDDREWLNDQSDEVLDKLSPVVNEEGSNESASEDVQEDSNEGTDEGSEGDADVTANSATTPEEFIANAPSEIQEVLSNGLRMQRDQKQKLIKEILANERNSFNEDELKGMDNDQLKKLSALGNTPSYEGQGGGEISTNKADDETAGVSPAPLVFEAKSAANE